jgi:hypothetical protein
MEIRDPIHGPIELDAEESALIHQPFLQRLRRIRQVGFSHLPFPGAGHSRFAHVVGVMYLAGRAFDRAYAGWVFADPTARERFRAAVRLAALCHDLGHAPFSHCTEFAMPDVAALEIPWFRAPPSGRRATHEDYTIAILAHTGLGEAIRRGFPCDPRHVAALVSHEIQVGDDFFRDGGLDHRRMLSQIISSEVDVDRLDYLVRDATFTGARYGLVDAPWILSHLSAHTVDGQVALAIDASAIFAVEDFLVSRHHMFLQVYFHHTSVVYEEMLKRHVDALAADPSSADWAIPADLDAFLWCDDIELEHHLRVARTPWARRIVQHEPYRRVLERHGQGSQADVSREAELLAREGFDVIQSHSDAALSRYALGPARRSKAPIFVVGSADISGTARRVRPLDEVSAIFDRYAGAHRIARLYVAPEERERARATLIAQGAGRL